MIWYQIADLVLLGIVSVLHLVSCLAGWRLLRSCTKVLLVPLILSCYLVFSPSPDPLVLMAQVFGWVGDLLLLSKRKRNFVLGAVSFLVGHGFYVAAMLVLTVKGFPPYLLALAALLFGVPLAAGLYFRKELARERVMKALPIYFTALGALLMAAAASFWTDPRPGTECLLMGALLFLLSDTILVHRMLRQSRAASYGSFWVMLTYIAAQALLATGFVI